MPRLPRPLRWSLAVGLLTLAGVALYLVRAYTLPAYSPPAVRHAVPTIDGEVRLAVLGDWGSGYRAQADVARAIDQTAGRLGGLHAGLLLGDNFYNQGIRDVEDPQLRTKFEEVYDTPWLGRMCWHAVLGNHDYDGNPEAQIAYTARSSGRWSMPREYYRLDLPDAQHPLLTVLALDTNRKFGRWEEERAWLETELASLVGAPQAVVAVGHNPILTYCRKPNRIEPQMAEVFVPLLDRYPVVDLYLAGHAHVLELVEQGGRAYGMVGGGGKQLHEAGTGPGSRFSLSEHGFAVLVARPDRLSLTFFDSDAEALFTWEKAIGADGPQGAR